MRNVRKRVMMVMMALCMLLGMAPVSTQAATKSVTYKAYKTATDNLVILLKNETKKAIGVETTVKFYNKAGKVVGTVTESVDVVYGKCEQVQMIYAPTTEAYEAITYSKYKVSVKAIKAVTHSQSQSTSLLTGKVGSYNKEYEGIEVVVKNGSKVACYMEYTALFFNDGKFKAVNFGGSDIIQPKGTEKTYVYDINDDGTKIKYDSIKIVINRAVKVDENGDIGL